MLYRHRWIPTTVFGVALLGTLAFASLQIGAQPISASAIFDALVHPGSDATSIIVWRLRVPRTLLAILVGAALAVAGAVMQALGRNPLADPGILGVNAGAAAAVVLGLSVFGITSTTGQLCCALAGSAVAAVAVFTLAATRVDRGDPVRLVLCGAAMAACLSAVTGIITMYNSDVFAAYRFWVIGSLEDRGAGVPAVIGPVVAVGVMLAAASAPGLNLLHLGDETAASLGARLGPLRLTAFTSITLLCGAATAAAGPLGFVGLVTPHAIRLLAGVDQRTTIALCVVAGPVLVLVSDILGRTLVRPGELEVGVVTAFIGAPVLLWLATLAHPGGAR